MKYSTFLFVFFSFFLSLAQEQCDNPVSMEYSWNNTTLKAMYCGQLDDTNEPSGFGKMIYENTDFSVDFSEGYWKDGKLNGEGMEVRRDGRIYEGIYVNDQILSGTYTREQQGVFYKGEFKDDFFHGENGSLTITRDNVVITREGLFKKGQLFEGIINKTTDSYVKTKKGNFFNNELEEGEQTIQYKNSGIIVKSTYTNGLEEVTYRNDQNSYNTADISGNSSSIEVVLERKGSVDNGKLAYHVALEIDGVLGEFVLDTGAMTFSIGKKMFERLKRQGIEFLDLNKKVVTVGVGGQSQGKLILLNNVKIGDYTLSNVVAKVSLDSNFSLLGTGFLLKFSNVIWDMKKEKLMLYK
tara:strand:- start:156 stop:1217 length:1062 start_codon:yes stop_codon:yes gene_type:complete